MLKYKRKTIKSNKDKKELLILANPDFSYLSGNNQTRNTNNNNKTRAFLNESIAERGIHLSQLPFAEKEGKIIKNLYNNTADLLTGKEATETEFRKEINNYKNYHIATHGIVNNKDPYMSSIILSPGNKNDSTIASDYDGILFAYELAGLDLNLDTIVLSACDTGLGQMEETEGIIGLSRSFLIAGVNSLISSLWKVSDASTSKLMEYFYKNKESLPTPEALTKAKLELINTSVDQELGYKNYKGLSYAHPYFWAPFILTGDN